jgi:predicted amidohydrolase
MAGCCQLAVLPGDIDENLGRAKALLQELESVQCRLTVLPEMWACAFPYQKLHEMAKQTSLILESLCEFARSSGMVLIGSLPESIGQSIYNTNYVVDADGSIAGTYRKIHLFSLHGENRHFTAGNSTLVVPTAAGKLGIMTCYDLRFPELARRLALDGAEILCVSAQWPVTRIEHWSLLLRARAIENQLFVIGCNGCGTEGKLQYAGRSAIISPYGVVLAEGGSAEEPIMAKLEVEEIRTMRELIGCFADRVPHLYGLGP